MGKALVPQRPAQVEGLCLSTVSEEVPKIVELVLPDKEEKRNEQSEVTSRASAAGPLPRRTRC